MTNRAIMEPNWKPLETRLGPLRCAGFMYMGRVNGINLYKHGISRTYLNLDDDGNCYVTTGSARYAPIDFNSELAKLEELLNDLHASLETPYDESFIGRKRDVLRQKGISLLTIQVEPKDILIH